MGTQYRACRPKVRAASRHFSLLATQTVDYGPVLSYSPQNESKRDQNERDRVLKNCPGGHREEGSMGIQGGTEPRLLAAARFAIRRPRAWLYDHLRPPNTTGDRWA